LNVATPATAARVAVPDKTPPGPALFKVASVTLDVSAVRFPNWSSNRTVIAGAIAAPATAFDGCCPNASCVAAAAVMLKPVLVAEYVSFNGHVVVWRKR